MNADFLERQQSLLAFMLKSEGDWLEAMREVLAAPPKPLLKACIKMDECAIGHILMQESMKHMAHCATEIAQKEL